MCPNCDMHYDDFRTGLSYSDVYATFWRAADDQAEWHPKRRNSILGRWHEIKQEMWAEHLTQCQNIELTDCQEAITEY
jgi:hypothetical protein